MSRTSKTRGETLALCRGGAGTKAALLYRMEQADAEKRGGEEPCIPALGRVRPVSARGAARDCAPWRWGSAFSSQPFSQWGR